MLSVEFDVNMSSKKKRAVKQSSDFSLSNGQGGSSKDSEVSNDSPIKSRVKNDHTRMSNFNDTMPHLDGAKSETDMYNYSKYPHYNNYNILNYMHYQQPQPHSPFPQSNPQQLQPTMPPFSTSLPNLNTSMPPVPPLSDKPTDIKTSDSPQGKKSSHHVATPMLSQLLQYPMVPKDSKVNEYELGLQGTRPEWHPRSFLQRPASGQEAPIENNVKPLPQLLSPNCDPPLNNKDIKTNDVRTDKKIRSEGRGRKRGSKRHEGKSKRIKKELRSQKIVSEHNEDDTMSDNSSSTEVYSQASCGSADEDIQATDHPIHNQIPIDQRIDSYAPRSPNFSLPSLRQGLNSPNHMNSKNSGQMMMQNPTRPAESYLLHSYPTHKDPYRMPFPYQNNSQNNSNQPYPENYQGPYYDPQYQMRNERPDTLSRNSMARFERPVGPADQPYQNQRMEYSQNRQYMPQNESYRYNYRSTYYQDPRFNDQRFPDPRFLDPRLADHRFSDPRFADPKFSDHKIKDPRYPLDPRFIDPKISDFRVQDPRFLDHRFSMDSRFSNSRISMDPRFMDPRFSDHRIQDSRYMDPRFQDSRFRQQRPGEEMYRHGDGRPSNVYNMSNHFSGSSMDMPTRSPYNPPTMQQHHQQQIQQHQPQNIPNYRPYMSVSPTNSKFTTTEVTAAANNDGENEADVQWKKDPVEGETNVVQEEKLKGDDGNVMEPIKNDKIENMALNDNSQPEKTSTYTPNYPPQQTPYNPTSQNMYSSQECNYRPESYHQSAQPHYRGYTPGYTHEAYRSGGEMYESFNGIGPYPRFHHNGQPHRYSENATYRHDPYASYRPFKDHGPQNMGSSGPLGQGGMVVGGTIGSREMEHGEVMKMRNPGFDPFSGSSPASTPGMDPAMRNSIPSDASHFRPTSNTPDADTRPDSVLDASSSGGPMSLASSDSESLKGRCQSRSGCVPLVRQDQSGLRSNSNPQPPSMTKQDYYKHGTYSPAMGHPNMMISPRMGHREDMISPTAAPAILHSSRHGDNPIFVKICELGNEPDRFYFLERLFDFMNQMETPINNLPMICKQTVDLYRLYQYVREKGGMMEVTKNKKWRDVSSCLNHGASSSAGFTLKRNYAKYLFPFECRFDRGNIDPGPILATMELNFKKDSKKLLSGGLDSDGSSRQYSQTGLREMGSPPGHYNQNADGYSYHHEYQRPPYQQGQYSEVFNYHGNRSQQQMGTYHRPHFSEQNIDPQKQLENGDFNGGCENYPSYYGAPSFQHHRTNNRTEMPNSFGQQQKNMIFPPGSIESTKNRPLRKKKLNHKDIGLPIDMWRLFLALKSGLAAETTWSLDVLSILLRDDATASNFYLANLPGLLELILDHFRMNIVQIFEKEFSDLEITYDQVPNNNRQKLESNFDEDRTYPSVEFPLPNPKISIQTQDASSEDLLYLNKNDPCTNFYSGFFDWQMGCGNSTNFIASLMSSDDTANFSRERYFCSQTEKPVKNCVSETIINCNILDKAVEMIETITNAPLTCLQIDAIRNLSFNGSDPDDTFWSIKSLDNSRFHANISQRKMEIAGRCQVISGVLRNLSFIIGNDVEMCRHAGLLVIIGRLMTFRHQHSKKKKVPTATLR